MKNNGFILVDTDGKLLSLSDGSIERNYQYIVDDLVDGILKISKKNVRSIVLRGSVAYKNILPGISDIDIIIILYHIFKNEKDQIEKFAAVKTLEYKDIFSTVDLSCYEYKTCLLPENNRLLMNIKLTGYVLYGEDIIKKMPDVYCDITLAKKIFFQTVEESKETLQLIKNKTLVHYMGIERPPSFLCVWYMRSFCRGLIAFSMLKENKFSLNVLNSCEEFVKYYPEYNDLIRECQRLEKSPTDDWKYMEEVAEQALNIYILIGQRKMGW